MTGPSRSIVKTTSALATAASGVAAARAPAATTSAVRVAVRFQTVTSCPAASNRRAIGEPIRPVPSQAMRIVTPP
ncbi:MAG: hypothetical protein BWY94_02324 [Actinobacteria bacterium ADurb.BinA094]|nr:MAG: hypothetical protein BWY94_02324 [Actinobacteria bacterium ADurb.BinA094]